MNRKQYQVLWRWLRAERGSDFEEAEDALRKVFSLLPEEPVPVGFAEQVLTRAGLIPASALPQRSAALIWGSRAALSLCLVFTALFLLVLPSYLPALMGIFHFGRLTEWVVSSFVGVVQQLGVGLVVWQALSAVGSILSSVLSSPPYMATLLLAILMSVGALRALHELVVSERSSRYVGSI